MLPRVPVTMRDIAESLDVSVVTVSKVLRNKGKISAATRKRVLRRAQELRYQVNWVARSLVTRRTYTIGLLLPDFSHPFFAEIAKTIAEAVRPEGYHVLIAYFEEDPQLERAELEALAGRQVDGVIAASASARVETFAALVEREIPVVLIDRPVPGLKASFVGSDHAEIGRLVTRHLVALGRRRIAHLRGPKTAIAEARLAGYRSALKAVHIPFVSRYVVEAGYLDTSGYAAMQALLQKGRAPDGVFCYNDPVAIGAMQAIVAAGLRVPDDIAVAGAGNVHYSDALAIPLTTVDQGAAQIGRKAAELLLAAIGAQRAPRVQRVTVPLKLVVRVSTKNA
jgi:LacI family transcriptional regulator